MCNRREQEDIRARKWPHSEQVLTIAATHVPVWVEQLQSEAGKYYNGVFELIWAANIRRGIDLIVLGGSSSVHLREESIDSKKRTCISSVPLTHL